MGLTFYSYGRDSQLPMGLLLFARVRTNNQYSLEPSIHPNTVDILLSTAKKAVFIANQKILKMSPLLEDSELGKTIKNGCLAKQFPKILERKDYLAVGAQLPRCPNGARLSFRFGQGEKTSLPRCT